MRRTTGITPIRLRPFPSYVVVVCRLLNESSGLASQRLRQAYFALDLNENASVHEVRKRYAHLARKYHPDTGGDEADPSRLERVRDAYKLLMKNFVNDGVVTEAELSDEKDFGIKHIVPQHRQYLEYGGIGSGSPSTRLRQYQQYRVMNALENVREFTIEKTIQQSQNPNDANLVAVNEQRKRQKHRLTGMIDRVVEDMILSSMATGEFTNLKGAGKPLKMDQSNPYIDSTELRINRILRDNGFSPPWIVKENELRNRMSEFRQRLRDEFALKIVEAMRKDPSMDSPDDFNSDAFFNSSMASFVEKEVTEINRLVQNYNLIAPSLDRQFMPLRKDMELSRANSDVLADFPNSSFIVSAKKEFECQSEQKKTHE